MMQLTKKTIGELARDHADAIEKEKYLSSDGSFAGALLFSIPKDTPNTMSNSEFRAALKFSLGIQFTTLLPEVAALVEQKSTIMVVTYSLATNLKTFYLCNTMPSNMTSNN
jgi:hypothetical protein